MISVTMAKDTVLAFNVRVDLRESEVDALKNQSKEDVGSHIQKLANAFVRQHSLGGLMLTQRDIEIIEKSSGGVMTEAKDVISAVLEGKGRRDGNMTVPVQIDPSIEEAVKQQAEAQGWSVEELLDNTVNWMLSNGMAYSMTPEGGAVVPLSAEDHAALSALLGRNVVWGTDLVAAIRKAQTVSPSVKVA